MPDSEGLSPRAEIRGKVHGSLEYGSVSHAMGQGFPLNWTPSLANLLVLQLAIARSPHSALQPQPWGVRGS